MLNVETMLETALWSTIGYDDNNLDEKYSIADVPQKLKDEMQKELDSFYEKALSLFTEDELENGNIEHDFWLTVHGHGAGFWDGDYQNGDELTELCKQFKTFEDDLIDSLTN